MIRYLKYPIGKSGNTTYNNAYTQRVILPSHGILIFLDNVTYKIMQEEVEALGKFLINKGYINKRIAVIGENSYQWMLVFLTVLSCGGTIVPLDRGLLEYELDEQLSRANAEVVFCSEIFYEHLSSKDIAGLKYLYNF